MNEFYVYLHRRATDNRVFYVGKGFSRRAWRTKGRNVYWNRTAKKHGLVVEILKGDLTESEAFCLEIETIASYGRDTLCNGTDGGEGVRGYKMSPENIAKVRARFLGVKFSEEQKAKMNKNLQKKIYCSNGMIFEGSSLALKWLRTNGHPTATQTSLSRCAMGLRKSAYDLAWSYEGIPVHDPLEIDRVRRGNQSKAKKGRPALNRISVVRSDGLVFPGATLACQVMKAAGFLKASVSPITACCRGKRKTAYGYAWEYEAS